MLHFYDVYDSNGKFVGIYDWEYMAEQVALEYGGYYTERFEQLSDYGFDI